MSAARVLLAWEKQNSKGGNRRPKELLLSF